MRLGAWLLPVLVTLASLPAAAQAPEAALPYGLIPESRLAERHAQEIQPLWDQRVTRGHFTGVGGLRLAYAAVRVPDARGAVVIVSGRTENLLKYQEVVADLVRQGYAVYLHDHRGQGFSDRLLPDAPEKGHVARFDDYVDDLHTFIEQVVKRDAPARLLLLAHSMGGGIATRYLEQHPDAFAAAALSSPMHQPNAKILVSADSSCEWFKDTGWLFSESWAGLTARPAAHLDYDETRNEYTHSAVRWARVLQVEREHPGVKLGGPTRGWVREACAASDRLIEQAGRIRTPVLVLQAGADTAVTPEGQDAFCAALRSQTGRDCEGGRPLKIEGARHELLIERDDHRVAALSAILGFFDRASRQP